MKPPAHGGSGIPPAESARWLAPLGSAGRDAKIHLWCFPFAGGGATIYSPMRRLVAPWLLLRPVSLPGREVRLNETSFENLEPLIDAAVEALGPSMTPSVALFGYSMGALIAFELARALRRRGFPQPNHLFVGAHRAPQLAPTAPPIHQLPPAELRDAARSRFGHSSSALDHPELAAMLLPILRADLAMCERYAYRDEDPLDCPISVLGGADDSIVHPSNLVGWNEQSRKKVMIKIFPGDHFFIQQDPKAVFACVQEQLLESSPQ